MSIRQIPSNTLTFQASNNIRREEEFAVGKYRLGAQQHRQQQNLLPKTRVQKRPNTAGAGTGGVPGVLARLGGYEKVTVNIPKLTRVVLLCELRNRVG